MFKNYLTIAVRHLRKQKMYSAIKIGGFALGIASCLLIALYIRDELSYDKSYPDTGRIFRVTGTDEEEGTIHSGADWPAPMAAALKADFPEIELSGRLMPHELFTGAGSNNIRITGTDQNTYEERFSYADQQMLDILKIPMVYGDRRHALSEPGTMVISKRKADKYFPNENPVGKTMMLNDDKNKIFRIGGVMADFPATSHIQYDFLLTMMGNQFWPGEQTTWMASNYYTYILVKPGTNPAQLQDKLKAIITKYYIPVLKADGNKQADDMAKKFRLLLQPISDVHINANVDDELAHGDIRFVWLFGAVAGFILLLACINFINLTTAKSANRAKEVGLRKVVGSSRGSLVQQFLTESMLFALLSFILGVLLAWAMLPYFNMLSAKSMTIPWSAWWLFPLIAGGAIITGVLAGLYPSLYLSSFRPIAVLKGQVSRGSKSSLLRNGLVVFQFAVSIVLIICTFVIYNQTHFILNTKLGFDKNQVVMIQGVNMPTDRIRSFKNELLKQTEVKSVSISDFLPVSGTKRNGNTFYNEGKTKEESGVFAQAWWVDNDYLKTMGMKLSSGRNFSPDIAGDSQAVIINQAMVNKLHLKDPVGKRIAVSWAVFNVIGVVDNFNFESMRGVIDPICLHLGTNASIVSVKLNATETRRGLASIESVWKKFVPGQPIRTTFLDESFANMYDDVQRMGRIFSSFAVLAIVIACLGLFALSAFMAEQRNKEIGIRKVLGATVSGITAMLSKDFVKLVLLSIVIALPIAGWGMHKWLQDFAYRAPIAWWIFAIAAGIALLIALVTISFQSIRAALMNPVRSLRSE
jgi:putative ABC transport system permease protein